MLSLLRQVLRYSPNEKSQVKSEKSICFYKKIVIYPELTGKNHLSVILLKRKEYIFRLKLKDQVKYKLF